MSDKYDIAKKIFDENIAKIELPIGLSKTLDQDYVCKPLDQILADKYALCTEQIELAEHIFTQYDIKVNKYQLFAVPKDNRNQVKIDLSHTFIGIPNDQDWILFEAGFRAKNRGGVKRFPDANSGLRYVLNLYKKTLIINGIPDLALDLYKYNFSVINQKFSAFANQVLTQAQRINFENTL